MLERVRRLGALLVLTLALALVGAPAWADPPGPTNYRAEVLDLTGAADGVSARVEGGDSFLVLVVDPGVEVLVPGYEDGDEYLRVDADGAVYENRNSFAYYQNLDRYGAPVPDGIGPGTPAQWVQVSDSGVYAWHDHRIHWMAPTPPRQIDTAADDEQTVFDWEVPLVVGGQDATITGTLTWLPATSPVLPLGLAGVAFAVGVVVVRVRDASWVALVAGLVVAGVAASLRVGLEPGMDPNGTLLPLAVVAVAGPALAARAPGHPKSERAAFIGAGAAAAVAAVVLLAGVFTNPVLPGALPDAVLRALVALAAGAAGAAIVGVAQSLVPTLPEARTSTAATSDPEPEG